MFIKIISYLKQEEGSVLSLTAIFLPVILVIGGLIVDGGRLYLRQGELQHLSRQAANSGMINFSNTLEQQATQNYNSTCSVLIPPSICSSSNIYDFLSATDIQNLIFSLTSQTQVEAEAESFALNFDPALLVSADDIEISFPYEYEVGDSEVKISISIESTPNMFFSHLLGTNPISVEAHSFLSLNL